jgi:hypothetical protein
MPSVPLGKKVSGTPDWKIKLAFCWSHQRRDFVNLAEGSRGPCKAWAQEWVGLINQLFKANRKRRKAVSAKGRTSAPWIRKSGGR